MPQRMQHSAAHRPPPLADTKRYKEASRCRRRQVACRGVVPQGERDGWWRKDSAPNLVEVQDGLQDIMAILEANRDRLVIVDYFAPWCASCKALYPKLNKICSENPDNLVVAKVNFEENKDLAKQLGVKVLPFFHAYHGSMGRVAAFSSSITKIQRLKDCIKLFGQPYCDVASHNNDYDVAKSLPEFDSLPHPDEVTVLKFTEGEYDQEATMAEKQKKAAASNGAGTDASAAGSENEAAQEKEPAGV